MAPPFKCIQCLTIIIVVDTAENAFEKIKLYKQEQK